MGTALTTGGTSKAPPAIKLRNVGDAVRFAVVDITLDLPMTEYGTDRPKLNSRGKQMTQHALTVLVTTPMQGVISVNEGTDYEPCKADELHTIYISSWAKWDPDGDKETAPYLSWGGATDAAGLEVGMVGEWKFVREVPGAGAQPRKDRRFRLRKPNAEEAALAQRCEELHAELASAKTGGPTQLNGQPNDDDGSEPF